ncbi:MAG: phenylalanine--tRNA ligase subunit beta [Chloroflexi bacterium]|nr:phenylalanine--tRNA ligase subunit beta [Chloroflexota bacterium]
MKVSLSWLKEYVDVTLSAAEVARKLTMAGLEVKTIENAGGRWENIFVGQLVAVNPHPNADRLRLATADLGTERVTVVCGAPNLSVGDKIAFARVGAELIDGHTGEFVRLKSARIRGVESTGMVCSEKELGISDEHQGILVLAPDAPVGMPLADHLGDAVFTLEVTPNRPDCLSVIGLAREVAALTGQKVRLPATDYAEFPPPTGERVSIEIRASDLCPRYCASIVTDVRIGESPPWMQHRLLACGMRPINNIVDITNYVLLEYGQPLHAFDYSLVRGKKIIVRRAIDSEKMTTLDGNDRLLSSDMLVIADAERAVAIAGVMGGANSEVAPETTTILLESASFNPVNIHYTARTLGLPSEASQRFERGISPELTVPALKRATQLMMELAGGKAAQGYVDVYPGKREAKPILLSTGDVRRILGADFSLDETVNTLALLGFDCQVRGPREISVTAPYWRTDIRYNVDLIEEVARILGYDRIPTTMLCQAIPPQSPEPIIGLKRQVRNRLAGYGFQEIVSYSLTSRDLLGKLLPAGLTDGQDTLRLMNPMTVEQEYLRPTLRAGLLAALSANRKYEESGIRLFEVGRVYMPRPGDLPEEREKLCAVLNGPRAERSWHGDNKMLDFFDAKGVVETLLGQLGVPAGFERGTDTGLHPARQATILVSDTRVGVVGDLHPRVAENLEIVGITCVLEIDLPALLPFTLTPKVFQPLPRFPAVVRDMAMVVGTEIPHRQVADLIKGFPLVIQVALFDVYSGEQVPPGKKSLAYRVTFYSPDRTLTDEEVNGVLKQVLDRLGRELGATLRV